MVKSLIHIEETQLETIGNLDVHQLQREAIEELEFTPR